jgi:hypothetical protein
MDEMATPRSVELRHVKRDPIGSTEVEG